MAKQVLALEIEPDDGEPVDEEQMEAVIKDGPPKPGTSLVAIGERLRKCKRPATCWWTWVE